MRLESDALPVLQGGSRLKTGKLDMVLNVRILRL